MEIDFVDLKAQYNAIAPKVDAAIHRVVAGADFILGKDVELFKQEFAAFCGVNHGTGVDSRVSALELALRAYGVGEGDEVITVSQTFSATALVISQTGAQPVFIDVDERTYNMRPDLIESAITSRTTAILPVHLMASRATSKKSRASPGNTICC